MPRELSFDLLRLDPAIREALLRLRDKYGLSDTVVEQLAWAAFYRHWDGAMLEAWAAAKSTSGDRLEIPHGPVRKAPAIDPLSPWAFTELGLRNGVLPGGAILDDDGWGDIGGRTVALSTYTRATRKLLRERAAANPDSTLAAQLRALEAERRRARLVVALTSPAVASERVPRASGEWHRVRRPRRTRRRRASGRIRARGGADPPGPPAPGTGRGFASANFHRDTSSKRPLPSSPGPAGGRR
jgi:hypothetical protein